MTVFMGSVSDLDKIGKGTFQLAQALVDNVGSAALLDNKVGDEFDQITAKVARAGDDNVPHPVGRDYDALMDNIANADLLTPFGLCCDD